jgi:dihydrofolate reductase
MSEVVLYIACSLDGYIATPDGGLDWLPQPDPASGGDYGFQAFYDTVDALLIGSTTYQQVAGWGEWPHPGKSCWVFSSRDIPVAGPDVILTSKRPVDALAEMAARGQERAWLVGGGKLVSSFRAVGLISEYIVTVIPVILGAGLPLFPDPGPREELRLVESRAYPDGLVQSRYLPIRR